MQDHSLTRQPTHHGYAVNVKDYELITDEQRGPLSDLEVETLYEQRCEDFWELAQEIAQEHGFRGVYSEGSMGGWAQPTPQPATDDMWEHQVAAWVEEHFRPFERDLLALMAACREAFMDDLAAAREIAKAEPAEAAYWAACDVVTVDR